MRRLRHREVRCASIRFFWPLRHWHSALEFITSPSLPPSHQPDTGRWTFSHFTEATTEAQKSAAELGDGIRPSDGGVRPESGGAAGTGAQGREWASASSPPPQGTEPGPLQRARQVRGQWARHSGRARVGAGEGPKQAEPHAHPPSHPPFLPWLVAGEWVSRNRQAAEKTGRRRNQITHLQL